MLGLLFITDQQLLLLSLDILHKTRVFTNNILIFQLLHTLLFDEVVHLPSSVVHLLLTNGLSFRQIFVGII